MIGRVGIVGVLMFTWGSPQFEDLRPKAVDVPLVKFHDQVRVAVKDTTKILGHYNDMRTWKHVVDASKALETSVSRKVAPNLK